MKKVLIVDIGNTTTQFGVFDGETFVSSLTISTHPESKKEVYTQIESFVNENKFEFEDGMVFSVVPQKIKEVLKIARKYFQVELKVFDWENYVYNEKTPEITDKIGADLLADLVAAKKYYGGPNLIADLGTVNKILLTNKENIFTGCSFAPGMQGSIEFFFKNTALLPHFNEIHHMEITPATNTLDAMKHGVYWSTVGFVNSVYEKLNDKNIKIILTGGNSNFIKDDIKGAIYDKELTLKGMYILFRGDTK